VGVLNVRRKEDGTIDKVRNYCTVTGHNDDPLRAKKVAFLIHVQEGALIYSYTYSLKASVVHLVRPHNKWTILSNKL
jgi:hypothetical protein